MPLRPLSMQSLNMVIMSLSHKVIKSFKHAVIKHGHYVIKSFKHAVIKHQVSVIGMSRQLMKSPSSM